MAGRDLALFSAEWFSCGRSLLDGVRIAPECSARVQFEAEGTQWFLTIDGGRVTGWDLGSIEDRDVDLRLLREAATGIVLRELRGTAAMQAATAVAPTSDGTYVGPLAPCDLAGRPELAAMPVAPGATLEVQYVLRRGPFGDVEYTQHYVDGRLEAEGWGRYEHPEVIVDVTYRALARVRAGEWGILEALEGGSVNGELGPLAALAGLAEGPEYHAAELATGAHMLALATLGELDSDPAYEGAIGQLAARTRPA